MEQIALVYLQNQISSKKLYDIDDMMTRTTEYNGSLQLTYNLVYGDILIKLLWCMLFSRYIKK